MHSVRLRAALRVSGISGCLSRGHRAYGGGGGSGDGGGSRSGRHIDVGAPPPGLARSSWTGLADFVARARTHRRQSTRVDRGMRTSGGGTGETPSSNADLEGRCAKRSAQHTRPTDRHGWHQRLRAVTVMGTCIRASSPQPVHLLI